MSSPANPAAATVAIAYSAVAIPASSHVIRRRAAPVPRDRSRVLHRPAGRSCVVVITMGPPPCRPVRGPGGTVDRRRGVSVLGGPTVLTLGTLAAVEGARAALPVDAPTSLLGGGSPAERRGGHRPQDRDEPDEHERGQVAQAEGDDEADAEASCRLGGPRVPVPA